MSAALTGLKLPFHFDPARLSRDLSLLNSADWSPHYNTHDFGGRWQAVSLRSANGSERDILAARADQSSFTDTPLLARSTYFRQILSEFHCPLRSVRLLSLAPGSFIREHTDNALDYEDGEVRIHIPIETNPGVEFYLCGERLSMDAGECYYVNVNLPHRVNNRGATERVHLVIDAEVNDWVREIFETRSLPVSRCPPRPGNLDEFRTFVLRNEKLHEDLRAIDDKYELIDRVAALGRKNGFDFLPSDVEAGFRSRPTTLPSAPLGWTPARCVDPRAAEWIFTGPRRFTEPFFEDTIRLAMRNPFTALFRVAAPLNTNDPIRPGGFIFHMSRCGSTLVARMLASLTSAHVISEAPPIDDVLELPLPRGEKIEACRRVVQSLGREGDYFIKLDAWHIRHLPEIREAFPGTPWIFVYRDPFEVLVSHLRMPGKQMIPSAADAAELTRPEWCARVLADFMESALLARADPNAMFVNYRDLPCAATEAIARHFRLSLSPEEKADMLHAATYDAKNPSVSFESDAADKQRASEALRANPAFVKLERLYDELQS